MLTVLLLVVWVGSAWWWAGFDRAPTSFLGASAGRVGIGWREPWSITSVRGDWALVRNQMPFQWWFNGRRGSSGGATFNFISIPIWVLVVLVAAPTLWLWRCDRRKQPGLCITCGYDLRGADHKVCPECGAALPARATR